VRILRCYAIRLIDLEGGGEFGWGPFRRVVRLIANESLR
jgi:hypothetical protein